MEMLSSAVVGEFMNRSISFLLSKLDKETTATMQEDLQRLCHLLLRSGAIIQDAEHRHVPSKAMLQQLKALRDETFRGYYVLDVVRCRAALGGDDRRRRNRNGEEDEVGRLRAFALSRFNPAKRVRFPSGGAPPPETDEPVVLGGARSPVELQQVVRSLEFMVSDMKEFVMFLGSYSPLYRQPYSAHLVVDRCMFGRQMEKEMVLEFLLKKHEPETLGVLPIVGPAHIGKSTLVEHVCGDERVRTHFSLILFYTGNDLKDVTVSSFKDRCMIKHHTDNNASQERQRLLVVIELLDDVDDQTWNELYSSQRSEVAEGSKIIITSRSEKVARFGTTQAALRMKSLPIEAYWYLLKTAAFGSDDPGQHPKMAALALEMADTVRGSFMFVYIGASLLRDNFNARVWSRVLTRLKQYLVKNASVIGEYPDDLKTRDNPRFTWSLVKPEPDKYFMLHDIYQRQGGSAQDEGVPAISYVDLLAGSDQPKGVHEILFWKSRIPPYFNYMCTCEIRDM